MARTEIGLIIDQLRALEEAVTGTAVTYDETPETVGDTPAWINMPYQGELSALTGWSEDRHVIICACLTRRSLLPSDEALMRPMITRFPDRVHASLTLSSTVAHVGRIEYEYGYIEAFSTPNDPMFGVLFRVEVIVKDTITVAV